jgi:myo-inositol 2-dehydrogenase/D-chiro-inositol 1-dehydrogenase
MSAPMVKVPRISILSFAHYHANFWTEAFLADPNASVTCIWDDDASRGHEAAHRFGVPFEPDLNAALAGCDAVAICSETVKHPELTRVACAAGRAILCEKPSARKVAEADAMAAAVTEAGVLYMQSFPKRFDPASHALKKLVDEGRLGRIHLVRIRHGHFYGLEREFRERWYVDPEKGGGGALLDEGVHGADLLNWFFGLPEAVTAEATSPVAGLAVDETATALFRYPDGMLAELTASFLLPAADTSIEIYGTRAAALLSGVDLASRDITSSGFLRVSAEESGEKRWDVVDVTPRFKLGHFHHQNAIGFVRCLRTGEAPPAGLEAGRAALLMIEAAYRAARTGMRQLIEPDPGPTGA